MFLKGKKKEAGQALSCVSACSEKKLERRFLK